ncbi:HoxN/HupN/NixA family nickel/cobalt transporter [Amycolatopsis rhabdoformis]|uniref:Nickel/cobalt efflux system n=1 Tax=Amycolatopsis rhabdoformis TaxID=1448059 RepID=A0ABZ1IC47_9PSEU|nr:HoxN/HupN/NixA family nickel/cobalt transporter [Amycolatopsis rhabdoformis]WSE31992.1 HoxN/HupN/NixA family nickel/cobalt transporter [Amycolatopsis rhabdoformis]
MRSAVLAFLGANRFLVVLLSAIVAVTLVLVAGLAFVGEHGGLGIGVGLAAFALGARHAFDVDHIAAIDNTARRLSNNRRASSMVGFWFALGHSTVVLLLTLVVAAGARFAATMTSDSSVTHQVLATVSTSASALFLCFVGLLNLTSALGTRKVYRRARLGELTDGDLERVLDNRGTIARLLGRLTRSLHSARQMFPVGLLFGVGFDTATEVTLLAVAGTKAAAGVPWYSVVLLPALFACGMTLFDTLDGVFMTAAYSWAAADPMRTLRYTMTITWLSVAVALSLGVVELVGLTHDSFKLHDSVTSWFASLDLGNLGYLVVALFLVFWAVAVGFRRARSGREPLPGTNR